MDVNFDPRVGHRRKRIEWPTKDADIHELFGNFQTDRNDKVSDRTMGVINEYFSAMDTRSSWMFDVPLADEHRCRITNFKGILRNLYWRVRMQSCFCDVFELLTSRGLVDIHGFELPVAIAERKSEQMEMVDGLVRCFDYISKEAFAAFRGRISLQSCDWSCGHTWLSTMISRGGSDLFRIFLTIESSKMLGPADPDLLGRWLRKYHGEAEFPSIIPIRDDNEGKPDDFGKLIKQDNSFGFILPHALGFLDDEIICQANIQFRRQMEMIEMLVLEEMPSTKGKIILESNQHEYFERHPERLPGHNNNLPDSEAMRDASGVE